MATHSSISKFLVQEGQIKFDEATKLSDEDSKNDPETEPFKSKYKARELWKDLQSDVQMILQGDSTDEESKLKVQFMKSVLDVKIGINFIETEELASGEDNLNRVLKDLEPHKINENACNIYQNALNQLGILWASRNENERAFQYLNKAECLYSEFKHKVGSSPLTIDEHFKPFTGVNDGAVDYKRVENFENTYTLTLYYLAQVYTKMGETEKSAKYCHVTLSRQLKTKKYDPFDWALNAATLSQYYITQGCFPLARHCLASASRVFEEVGDPDPTLQPHDNESQSDVDKREKIPRAQADIRRCWAKYGMALLDSSWNRLLKQVEEMDLDNEKGKEKDDDEKNEDPGTSADGACSERVNKEKSKSKLLFDLELTSLEDLITDKYCKDFEDARLVFLQTQKWLTSAKEFYILDGHASDFVELVQDTSSLYRLLAFFEPNFDRQCKMHKRRIDMLTELLSELNQQFYLLVCRQLIFEIGESYSTMLDLKLAILEEQGTAPTNHAVCKINHLTQSSIDFYKRYIDTLRTADKTLPTKFEDDDERPALIAHFYIGRLHSKFIELDTSKKIDNVSMSLANYKYIVDYCHLNPSAVSKVQQERAVCEEMVVLLPHKMEKIRQNNSNF